MHITISFSAGSISVHRGSEPIDFDVKPDDPARGEGEFYVYVHRDVNGKIFYVGEGNGRRAWSTDRHPLWHQYVEQRSGGKYTVQIVSYHRTKAEAEEMEGRVMARYGDQVVNWINSSRNVDLAENARFHAARNANRELLAECKALEKTALGSAIEGYKKAMLAMYSYARMTWETGLVAELRAGDGGATWEEPYILDRLTLCLQRAGRGPEALQARDEFLAEFPRHQSSTFDNVSKRCSRIKAELDKRGREGEDIQPSSSV